MQMDAQEAQEKMLNIASFWRNTNQNYNEVSPHTHQNSHHQKSLQTINAGEDVEKREPSYTVLKIQINTVFYGEQHGDSLKN